MELLPHLQVVPPEPKALVPRTPEPLSASLPAAAPPPPSGIADFWHLIWNRKWTVLSAAFLCGLAAFLLTLPQTPVYQAQTSLEIQGVNDNFLHMSDVSPNADLYSTEGYVQTQADVLESKLLVRRAAEKAKFKERFHSDSLLSRLMPTVFASSGNIGESTLKEIYKRLKVRTAPPTRLIRIVFDAPDPRLAADFANALATEYVNQAMEARFADGQNTIELLSRQMEDLKVRLREDEERLQNYTRSEGLTYLADSKGSVAEERLRQLETEYSKAQTDRITRESEYQVAIAGDKAALPRVQDSQRLAETQKTLSALRGQLAELSRALTPQHYKVQRLQAEIHELESELASGQGAIVGRIRNEDNEASLREKMLAEAYQEQKQVVADEAQKGVQYDLLRHEVETDRTLYDSMLQKVREAGIASAVRTSNVRVIDVAEPPARPYKPDIILNSALGGLSGLLLGVMFACAGEKHDRLVRRPGEARILANARELGVVPMLRGATPDVSDSVRSMLPSLIFLGAAKGGPRMIVVSSAAANEGKTTILRNLGDTLAEVAGRVLIVDADVHRPRLDALYGISNFWGLNNILCDTYPIEDYPVEALAVETSNGLFVLPSGQRTDNSAELIYSERLARLLKRLRREFDIILIDTPPLLETPEARVIGRLADGVILVVRSGQTSAEALGACTSHLQDDGAVLLGTVLNGWSSKNSPYNYRGRRKASA